MGRNNIIVDPERLVFAMDIGTRSIVGLVCYPENEKLRVLSTEITYHPQRDMLEQRKLEPGQRIRKEEIASLELEAVEKAKEILINETIHESDDMYYCVGYTTVGYYLDDYPITSLVGQQGERVDVEVLATFLPQVVVDSLLTVVEEIGLTIHNLTLEPKSRMNEPQPAAENNFNVSPERGKNENPDEADSITSPSTVRVLVNGEEITMAENRTPDFVDIFNYINFDRSKPKGKLIMTLNGQPAALTGKLKYGDEVYVYWEKER